MLFMLFMLFIELFMLFMLFILYALYTKDTSLVSLCSLWQISLHQDFPTEQESLFTCSKRKIIIPLALSLFLLVTAVETECVAC